MIQSFLCQNSPQDRNFFSIYTYKILFVYKWQWVNNVLLLEKWFPLQGERAHSLYFLSFQDQNREVGGTEQQQQTYQFTQGYNILHRLQVYHLTLTFIIHNKYIIYVYVIARAGVIFGIYFTSCRYSSD